MQSTAESSFFFVGGGSFSPMLGWRQLSAFVQRYQWHQNVSHSAGNSSLAHLAHKAFTVTHTAAHTNSPKREYNVGSTKCATFYLAPNHKSHSQALCSSHSVWRYCLWVTVYSKIRQRQVAWRLTQRQISEQTGLTKGLVTVTQLWPEDCLCSHWSRDNVMSSEYF